MRSTMTAGLAAATAAFVMAVTTTSSGQIVPRAIHCLHDGGESQGERTRREQALIVARAINSAEGQALQANGRFQPLASLPNIPALPDAFEARLYADANGYVISLKDTRDVCRFGIFSDQSGTVYSSTPTVPQLATR